MAKRERSILGETGHTDQIHKNWVNHYFYSHLGKIGI